MEIIDIINRTIKIWSINILTYIVLLRLISYKDNTKIKMAIVSIISLAITEIIIILNRYISVSATILICYTLYALVISKIMDISVKRTIVSTFIALSITYLIYAISVLIVGILLILVKEKVDKTNFWLLVLILFTEIILLNRIFNVRRLKKGILFLQDEKNINNIGMAGIFIVGVTMLLYSITNNNKGYIFATYIAIGTIIMAVCMFIWIRKKITKYYKQKLKENTIQELEKEIQQKDAKIKDVLEENEKIAIINHKYSSRITALEKFSAKILTKPEIISKMKEEFGEDFTELENQIKILTAEYKNEMKESLKVQNKIQKTNIFGIDKLLEYLKEEAEKNNIEFNLKLNGSINYMVENVIDQSKLETLLGDHIKDAIIAIQHSNNNYKKILVIIGIIDNYYEVCIYDTGIEFEINTLLKLGTEAITTHKQIGGSGIGFMTTFKTMNETKASLIIEENHKVNNIDFTKTVRIRFDGRNEYKIKSYRAEEINSKVKDNRIIIENI